MAGQNYASEDYFAESYAAAPWDTPADQVAAGYPWFIQPGAHAGSYEEIKVYVPDTSPALTFKIVMDVTRETVGTVTITPSIQVKEFSTDAVWTDVGAVYSGQPSIPYRLVKYRLDVSSPDGGVCHITKLRYRLQSKKLQRSGSAVTGSGGTVDVWLTDTGLSGGTAIFNAITSVQLTPRGTALRFAVWDVAAIAGTDHFHVYLYDQAGNPVVGGAVDWTVTGV